MTLNHQVVACGGTTTAALDVDKTRSYALFVNDSDVVIYLNVAGASAVVGQGIRLNPNGGSFEMSHKAGNCVSVAVNAIAASGSSKNLLVTWGY